MSESLLLSRNGASVAVFSCDWQTNCSFNKSARVYTPRYLYATLHRVRFANWRKTGAEVPDSDGIWFCSGNNQMPIKIHCNESGVSCCPSLWDPSYYDQDRSINVAFILPPSTGYVASSRILEDRMGGMPNLVSISSWMQPRQHLKARNWTGNWHDSLNDILETTVGMVILDTSVGIETFDKEISNRLALPWVRPTQPPERRVAYVLAPTDTSVMRHRWEAVAALGIKLVVISSGGWWSDNAAPLADLREGFVSIDLTTKDGRSSRIADAVRNYPEPINGIITTNDFLAVPVAEAAEALGLPTAGQEQLRVSTDKHLTRQLEPDAGDSTLVESLEDLEERLDELEFPIVCKPNRGQGSEGVFLASNAADLLDGARRIFDFAMTKASGLLLEPYIHGPELDINIVMREGRVLFWEVVDDFPSTADLEPESKSSNFMETSELSPSKLPVEEQNLLVKGVVASILRQGFVNGVLHCEARVRNSSMYYAPVNGSGTYELRARSEKPSSPPSVYLHEVNARPPGVLSSASTLGAWGVDLFALHVLCALEDWCRFEALAEGYHEGTQQHMLATAALLDVDFDTVNKTFEGRNLFDGSFLMVDSEHDPITELPLELRQKVLNHYARVKNGVSYGRDESTWLWASAMVICSNESRQDVLETAYSFEKAYADKLAGRGMVSVGA